MSESKEKSAKNLTQQMWQREPHSNEKIGGDSEVKVKFLISRRRCPGLISFKMQRKILMRIAGWKKKKHVGAQLRFGSELHDLNVFDECDGTDGKLQRRPAPTSTLAAACGTRLIAEIHANEPEPLRPKL